MKLKFLKIIIPIFLLVSASLSFTIAHSGRTDSNGGHQDYSTGTYHYHNDGDSVNSFVIPNNDNELLNELEKRNQNLEDKIYNLENEINEYKYSLEEYGYNSIDEMENKIDSLDTQIDNMWFSFFIVGLIAIYIAYNIGASKK